MPKLTIPTLCKEAGLFSASQSKSPEKALYEVTDGKAVGIERAGMEQGILAIYRANE
jgi:hypothetical protein